MYFQFDSFFLAGDQSIAGDGCVQIEEEAEEEGGRGRSILLILMIHFAHGIQILSLFVYNVDI